MRGKNPDVKGKIGVTIGMAQECAISSRIIRIKRFTIDGTRYLPDVWYDILGCPADFEREVIKMKNPIYSMEKYNMQHR